jgi:pyruvate,water dikinase
MKPKDLNLFMGGHQPDIRTPNGSPYLGRQGIRRLMMVTKQIRLISRYQKQQNRFFALVDQFVDKFNKSNLCSFSDTEFLDFVGETEHHFLGFNDKYMALCGGIGPFSIAINMLKPEFGDEAIGIVNALASGQGDLPSAQQGYHLLELAELARQDNDARAFLNNAEFDAKQWITMPDHSIFKEGFQRYLDKYGYRSTYEMDCSKPRWSEDPSYLLINIAKSIDTADVAAHKRRQQQAYERAEKQLREKAGFYKRKWIMVLIERAVKGAETREKAKSYTVKLSQLTQIIFLEAGRRLFYKGLISDIDDVFYCSQAEVYAVLKGYWDGAALPVIVTERKQAMEALAAEKAPDVVINGENIFTKAPLSDGGNLYKGIGVSAGVKEGRAEIIYNPDEGERLKPGDIMVAPSTDPAWTPLFIHAGGIVLETGGYTSHGSIVAREYGIPAVANVPGVLRLIKNGQTLVVNGNSGTITLI